MELHEALNKIIELEQLVAEKDQTLESYNIEKDKFTEQINAYESTITTLKENNMNLFLKVTQDTAKIEEKAPVVEEPKATLDDILNEW